MIMEMWQIMLKQSRFGLAAIKILLTLLVLILSDMTLIFFVPICRSFALQHIMCHLLKSEVLYLFTGANLVTNTDHHQDWTEVHCASSMATL